MSEKIELQSVEIARLRQAVNMKQQFDMSAQLAAHTVSELILLIRDQHGKNGDWQLSKDGKTLEQVNATPNRSK